MARHAEIAGAGFAGLAAACALARRGWSVRVHERGAQIRTDGAGIYIYENGLKVLEALGAFEDAIAGASRARIREVRDERNRTISVHHWPEGVRVFSILRQRVIDALAAAAQRHGVEILAGSEGASASPKGRLALKDGRELAADLVVAADGVSSRLRDGLGLLSSRRALPDGAVRLIVPKNEAERAAADDGRTIEFWSGTRRVLTTSCSADEIYVALTMLDVDVAARQTPIDRRLWAASFPHLEPLIARISETGHYGRFEVIRLKRWSTGRVVILGDAAHALPPNLGQGAGCSMMNALSLAVHLDSADDIPSALVAWEHRERPLTEHTQRMSVLFGRPTTWPAPLRRLFFYAAGNSRWLTEQRTRTARHVPTGAV